MPHTNELQQFMKFYDDFDELSLAAQLTILHGAVSNRVQKQLFDQLWRLTKLLLVVPATSATAERSFSALRRVKTYLRATISQTPLNSALILHCHQDRADSLNIVNIAQDFVCAFDSRSNTFYRASAYCRAIWI